MSATHLPDESLAVTVHGDAELIDIHASEHAEFKQTVLDIYTPRYGEEWAEMLDGGAWYARINPQPDVHLLDARRRRLTRAIP